MRRLSQMEGYSEAKEAGETGSVARLPPVEAKGWAEEAVETERCKRQRSSTTIETAGQASGAQHRDD